MGSIVQGVSDLGHSALLEIASREPDIFLSSDSTVLLARAEHIIKSSSDPDAMLFHQSGVSCDTSVFQQLKDTAVSGPSNDIQHAKMLYANLEATPSQMSDKRVIASLNCFFASEYVWQRWQSSTSATSDKPATKSKFVKDHWLTTSKESSGVARIWWLYEYARRAAKYSQNDTEAILDILAGSPSFYNQLLDRPYLMASDKVRGAIVDVAIETYHKTGIRPNKGFTNKLMRSLNNRAGGVCLDVLNEDELHNIVRECLPPK